MTAHLIILLLIHKFKCMLMIIIIAIVIFHRIEKHKKGERLNDE